MCYYAKCTSYQLLYIWYFLRSFSRCLLEFLKFRQKVGILAYPLLKIGSVYLFRIGKVPTKLDQVTSAFWIRLEQTMNDTWTRRNQTELKFFLTHPDTGV